ncbi:MAG: TonB-dependent receptor [Bacteroidota bacterium]
MKWTRWIVSVVMIVAGADSALMSQHADIVCTISDKIYLYGIDGAHISVFSGEDQLIIRGQTDSHGKWIILPEVLSADHFIIDHPAYRPLDIPIADLKSQGYHIFLEPNTFDMDSVVFSASKFAEKRSEVGQKIQVIPAREIAFQNPQTSADLLAQQGGVFVQKSQMGGGSPNLRGFEANKVLLVVDGIRMNNAIYRSGHLQNVITIDPSLIERTEVLFGPGSVMYGSDALGGVLHFSTKKPSVSNSGKIETTVHADTRYGSANHEKRFHADMNIGGENWASLSSVSITQFGELRTGKRGLNQFPASWRRDSMIIHEGGVDQIIPTEANHIMSPTGYTQYDAAQKFIFLQREDISHQLNVQFSSSTNIPRFDRLTQLFENRFRFAEWYYGPQTRLLAAYSLKIHRHQRLFDELNFTTAYQHIQESRHSRSFQSAWLEHREERLHIQTMNLDASKTLAPMHKLGYGAEIALNQVFSTAFQENMTDETIHPLDTRYPDGGSDYRSSAVYLTHKWNPYDRWTLSEGIRLSEVGLTSRFIDRSFYDFNFHRIQQQSTALSGNISIVFRPEESWKLSFLGSTGFRAPNLDDVAKVFDSQPGNVVVPNPDLEAEYTYNSEINLEKRWGIANKIGLSGFASLYDNAIVVRNFQLNGLDSITYGGITSQVQANVNAQQAYFWGVSFFANIHLGLFRLFHSTSYTYGQILDAQNPQPMDHIPPLFGQTGLEFESKKLKFNANIQYNGAKSIDRYSPRDMTNIFFATPQGSPAWWTLNVKGSWALTSHIQLMSGIENVLDQHYRPYSSRISAPGRNIYLALKSNW